MFKPLVTTLLSLMLGFSAIANAAGLPPVPPPPPVDGGMPIEQPDPRMPLILKALKANQMKWKAQKISNYTFTLARSCFCAPEFTAPIQITVKGGKVVKAVSTPPAALPAGNGRMAPANTDARDRAMTVDGLFKTIQEAVNSKAAQIDVKYDRKYGYPISIFVDRSRMMADEEMGLSASNLKPIPVKRRPHR
ncbi:MAG: DUF6174 domain-containing protein [Thiothrix sp.]|uniref:DUF6174 domain-containing protein n=1 Tax=Thiothrix sp. TaxID=1032 RepID=UPI0026224C6A|nr:DUF6174 domain-containing protein [Thiothrix sp.]MDD5392597.1 DUF6174 domain-containing protein [Thiothrix sp.]